MKVQTKGEFDEDQPSNPKVEEAYYFTELEEIIDYDRDDARGLVFKFRIVDDDVEVLNDFDTSRTDGDIVLPFFAPANLSKSEDGMSSRLTEQLEKLGLHEAVLEILNEPVNVQTGVDDDGEPVYEEMMLKEAVLDDHVSVKADSEDAAQDMKDALLGVFKGKTVRVGVEDGKDGEDSQVSKFSRIHNPEKPEEQEESESEEDESDSDAVFDEEDEEVTEDDDLFDDEESDDSEDEFVSPEEA